MRMHIKNALEPTPACLLLLSNVHIGSQECRRSSTSHGDSKTTDGPSLSRMCMQRS
jgi:hypothetical protein